MNKILTVFVLIIFTVISGVDARRSKGKRYNCNEKIKKAITKFEKGRYAETKVLIDEIKINCDGNPLMDTALFYLAKANLYNKNYSAARIELENHTQDYPGSPFSEEIYYLMGVCNYNESPIWERDQTKTKSAIRDFENFLGLFPKSKFADSANVYIENGKNKIAKKAFMTADLYSRLKKYGAAVVYYQIVLNDHPGSSFEQDAKLGLAKSLLRVSRVDEAETVLKEIKTHTKYDEKILSTADRLLKRVEKYGEQAILTERERMREDKRKAKLKSKEGKIQLKEDESKKDDSEITKEEPTKEEPTKEEPAKEEPTKEEPAKEEPAKEEATKEEATAEENGQ